MILLIDQGNSYSKWCLCDKGIFSQYNAGSLTDLDEFISNLTNIIERAYIASVKNEQQIENLTKVINRHLVIDIQIATSKDEYCLTENRILKNAYKIPEQLGIDRWLAMIAIWKETNRGFIVVDAGSALTLDVVDNSGQHLGGHIIPGLSMQKKSLATDTDKVLFDKSDDAPAFKLGLSTSEAVHHGCISNLCSYILEMHNQYKGNEDLPLLLTGGDAEILSKALKIESQVQMNLVLKGLYYSMFK